MIERIIKRIVGFPFFIILAALGALISFLKYVKNYILYGGEAISYTHKNQPRQIIEVYNKLVEIQNQKPNLTPEA